jgi:hypothetical protein
MMEPENWGKRSSGLLKAELKKQDLSYADLSNALKNIGIKKTTNNLAVTINRGAFSLSFFLQCMSVIGVGKIYLD